MKKMNKMARKLSDKSIKILLVMIIALNYILPIPTVIAVAPDNTGEYGSLEIGGNVTAIQDVTNGTSVEVSFTNNNKITVTGTGLYSVHANNKYTIYGNGAVTVTATPALGYSADLRYQGNLLGTTTANYNLTHDNPLRVDGEFSISNVDSTVNYSYTGTECMFRVNDAEFDFGHATPGVGNTQNSGTYNGNISYPYDSTGNVQFEFETFFTDRITSLVINGTEYVNSVGFPTTPNQLLNAIDGQTIHYVVDVPYAATYTISSTTVQNVDEYMTVGNFLWSYMEQDKDTDDYMGHGNFEFVKIKYQGVEYNKQQMDALNKGYMQWGQSENEGGALLPAGAEVTVKLLPDPGYQLTSFTINGGVFETGEEMGVYTFEIPRGNFHLGAHFTKVADKVDSNDSEAISSGSITLGGNESNIEYGTAVLNVKDVDLDENDINEFNNAAGNYKISNYLDISLFNTIYKGNTVDAWKEQVTELDHKATITLKLADDVDGNEVVIVHQKHDGTYEVIETTYDPVAHTITFVTDSFSNYAIASKTVDKTTAPKTGDNIMIYISMLGLSLIGLCGVVVYLKRKRFN